jgi:hypothetical protein
MCQYNRRATHQRRLISRRRLRCFARTLSFAPPCLCSRSHWDGPTTTTSMWGWRRAATDRSGISPMTWEILAIRGNRVPARMGQRLHKEDDECSRWTVDTLLIYYSLCSYSFLRKNPKYKVYYDITIASLVWFFRNLIIFPYLIQSTLLSHINYLVAIPSKHVIHMRSLISVHIHLGSKLHFRRN